MEVDKMKVVGDLGQGTGLLVSARPLADFVPNRVFGTERPPKRSIQPTCKCFDFALPQDPQGLLGFGFRKLPGFPSSLGKRD